MPRGRSFYVPASSHSATYESSAVPALDRFEWSAEIVGTSHKVTFAATP